MVFGYNELKTFVGEDFERFYNMGFTDEQILPAVLDEYKYGEDFCLVENICILLSLAQNYVTKGLNCHIVVEELNQLMSKKVDDEIKTELGSEYEMFAVDFNTVLKV